jgi:hypothetical protein
LLKQPHQVIRLAKQFSAIRFRVAAAILASFALLLVLAFILFGEKPPKATFLRYELLEGKPYAVLRLDNRTKRTLHPLNIWSVPRSVAHLVSFRTEAGWRQEPFDFSDTSGLRQPPVEPSDSLELRFPVDQRPRKIAIRLRFIQGDLSPRGFRGWSILLWDELRLLRARLNKPIDVWCPTILQAPSGQAKDSRP